jgi:hypothetical protein
VPRVVSSRARRVLRDSSLVDRDRNIRHVQASQELADRALRAVVPDLVHGQDLADRGQVDLARRVRAAPAALLRPEKHRDRNAPRTIGVVAVASSIRRLRKVR